MNLKEYLENELDVVFQEHGITQPVRQMSDSEVMDFCNYYSIFYYSLNSFKRELVVYQDCDEALLEFVGDWNGLAEYFNYSMVNKDLFIDNITVHDFKETLSNSYCEDINLMIKEWGNYINRDC